MDGSGGERKRKWKASSDLLVLIRSAFLHFGFVFYYYQLLKRTFSKTEVEAAMDEVEVDAPGHEEKCHFSSQFTYY